MTIRNRPEELSFFLRDGIDIDASNIDAKLLVGVSTNTNKDLIFEFNDGSNVSVVRNPNAGNPVKNIGGVVVDPANKDITITDTAGGVYSFTGLVIDNGNNKQVGTGIYCGNDENGNEVYKPLSTTDVNLKTDVDFIGLTDAFRKPLTTQILHDHAKRATLPNWSAGSWIPIPWEQDHGIIQKAAYVQYDTDNPNHLILKKGIYRYNVSCTFYRCEHVFFRLHDVTNDMQLTRPEIHYFRERSDASMPTFRVKGAFEILEDNTRVERQAYTTYRSYHSLFGTWAPEDNPGGACKYHDFKLWKIK